MCNFGFSPSHQVKTIETEKFSTERGGKLSVEKGNFMSIH